jgi:hypothetical protein
MNSKKAVNRFDREVSSKNCLGTGVILVKNEGKPMPPY